MAWTSPPTFVAGQVVTAGDLNTYLRDDLLYLLARNYGFVRHLANYSTTSLSFVDVDATNLISTVTINSGRALVLVSVNLIHEPGGGPRAHLDVIVDSTTRIGDATHGLGGHDSNEAEGGVLQFYMGVAAGLSVGSHTFKLQFRANSSGTAYINRVNATGVNLPISFMVLEI